jgi:hypothetical protein
MAFIDGVLPEVVQIDEGEVLATSPHNIDSFDKFEDGLKIGLFAKLDSGSVDNLDGSATPLLVGVAKRKINKAIGSDTYVTTPVDGLVDKVADVCNLGRITVKVVAGITPTMGETVYAYNNTDNDTASWGMATYNATDLDLAGTTAVANATTSAVFNKEVQTGIWVVTIQNYLV